MENRNSSLWIGLGIGTVIGTLAYLSHVLQKPRN